MNARVLFMFFLLIPSLHAYDLGRAEVGSDMSPIKRKSTLLFENARRPAAYCKCAAATLTIGAFVLGYFLLSHGLNWWGAEPGAGVMPTLAFKTEDDGDYSPIWFYEDT